MRHKKAIKKARYCEHCGQPLPRKPKDWTRTDWSRSNIDLAVAMRVNPDTVAAARCRYAPETVGARQHKYDWTKVDWKLKDKSIAANLGCSAAYVWQARKVHAPENLKVYTRKVADWLNVDWSLRNADIARSLQVSPASVSVMRRKQSQKKKARKKSPGVMTGRPHNRKRS